MQFSDRFSGFFSAAVITFRRFPHVLLSSAAFSTALCLREEYTMYYGLLSKLIMVFSIGIPAYFALAVFDERYTMRRTTIYLLHGVMAGALVLYFFSLPQEFNGIDQWRFALLNILIHLGVALAPFVVNNEKNAFWQFNRILFTRFLTAAFFSLLLFAGLSLAIYSCRLLLNIVFPEDTVLYLCYWIFTLNTWLFLSGIPVNVEGLENNHDYPVALKVFAAYVLMPLVVVFSLILYAYSIRVTFLHKQLGEEVILQMVALAVTGIIAYLFLWPLRKNSNAWITRFMRLFFPFILPLVLFLGFTAWSHMNNQVVSIEYVLLIVFSFILLLLCVYFIFSDEKNLRMIPLLFFVVILITVFSPYNVFDFSREKVMKKILAELKNSGRFVNEKISVPADPFAAPQDSLLYSSMVYINHMYGFKEFEPYLDKAMADKFRADGSTSPVFELMDTLHISRNSPGSHLDFLSTSFEKPLRVTGYDYQFDINIDVYENNTVKDDLPSASPVHWVYESSRGELIIFTGTDTLRIHPAEIYMTAGIAADDKRYVADNSRMILDAGTDNFHVTLFVSHIGMNPEPPRKVNSLHATALVKLKIDP